MAKLPPIDTWAIHIKDDLHRGKREKALAKIEELKTSGYTGPGVRALDEYLSTAKRGRQPFGAKHLWYDIGRENFDMIQQKLPLDERYRRLGLMFRMDDPAKLATAIATYNATIDERDD